jgi:hypothetical protein
MIVRKEMALSTALAFTLVVAGVADAPAQIGAIGAPAGPPPPILNPSAPMILPATPELPVSPATPSTTLGSRAPGYYNTVTGTAPILASPASVHHAARRHRYR